MTNAETFRTTLAEQYSALWETEDFQYVASKGYTPESLAEKMVVSFTLKRANKEGKGIKRACKVLKIPYTYKAIEDYLAA